MRAAIVHAMGDLRIEDVALPEVPAGSIRVRVGACGVCGTDLRIYRKGDHRAQYPVIPGHEIAGVVDAVAPGVTAVREGDRVCVAPGHGCGACRMCRQGQPNVCTQPFPSLGYKVNGGFAEYLAVPENILRLGFVNPIPASLTFQQAAMSEILACCLNAQRNSPVREGDRVLIIGAGPAGILHALLAKRRGAARVMMTQRTRARLDTAQGRFAGIDRVVPSLEEDLDRAVAEETGGEGADVVFVCAPAREAQEAACRLVGPRGRVNFFGGLPRDARTVTLDANTLHYKEFFIAGASSSLPEDNREALRLLAERAIDPDKLVTGAFPLADAHAAFQAAESRRGIKFVIAP
ncbi:MAG: alcohol dehydrogenase catalytic domain-containing protein [Armatimonadetes bacterium]|nr:alcohol dehydrogenase catalytic domain-containing protein [Armatimonadota bacterium]